MSVLAIDQGTTSTRAVLFDHITPPRTLLAIAHRQSYPAPGRVEHDPEELLANLRACLAAAADIADLAAIGIDNQGESCLAWDAATGEALCPVIVWQDDRTRADIARLARDGAGPLVRDRAGLPLDPYFSASKLGWIMRHVPRARVLAAAGRLRLGTTDAFFRDRLTGQCATDVTTASRTSLMNLATCTWDAGLCDLFGVPIAALPAIGASSGQLGMLRLGARGVPLTASLVDQQAALYGHGCRVAGDAKATFGTGAFALVLTGPGGPVRAAGALPTVAWQKAGQAPVYALDGGVHAAAAAVNWARGIGLFDSFAEIGAFAAPPAIARGLAFVPALAGLGAPHWDGAARGAWMGLGLDSSKADMMQALLEGVALRMAEVVAAMEASQPLSDPVSIDGGMTANRYFCQFLADVLGREVVVSTAPDLTAAGTAMLAGEAAGRKIARPEPGRRITPRPCPEDWRATFAVARRAVQDYGRRAGAIPSG